MAANTPTVWAEHGTFRAEWSPPEQMRLDIDHLRTDRWGDVIGELSIYSLATTPPARLHASRLNLSTVRARSELARYMAARNAGGKLDWQTMLEVAAVHAIDLFRRGDPAVLLRDLPRPLADRYLYPWALADDMVIHFGDGGDGKSMLALATAAGIASGSAELFGIAPAETRVVGYLDWESSGADHRDRLERLCGSDMPAIVYIRCDRPLVAEVDRLQRISRDFDLGYLVIDSAAYACDGPPESAESAAAFARAVRQLGLGSLVVAHVNRSGDDSRPFGSQFWHNNARATWNIKRSNESSGDRLTLGMFNRKANTGPLLAPVGIDFTFEPYRTLVERTEIHDVADLAERIPLKARMLRALRSGPKTYADLAVELEEAVDSISRAARRGEGRVFTKVTGQDGITRIALVEQRFAA